jgi:hypothetical protein
MAGGRLVFQDGVSPDSAKLFRARPCLLIGVNHIASYA